MKVQANEDPKVMVMAEEKAEGPSRSSFAPEYDVKPVQTNYVNFSKLVLLVLAIVASFLLCLIFARDLWGQKAEKPEIAHPQRQVHRAKDGPSHFPFVDDLLENLHDFPQFEKDFGKSDEDDPKIVSKTTKITFRLLPSDDAEPSHKQVEKFGGPSDLDGPIEDMLKMMMNLMGGSQQQSSMMEKPSLFSDLPMFNHKSNSVHPKLIIVRKLSPTASPPKDDDFLKNILDSLFSAPKLSTPVEDSPFPFFPLEPVSEKKTEPFDEELEKVFPFIRHIVIKKKPTAIIHTKPTSPKSEERPESWKEYKHLVSDMASSIDTLLDDTSNLRELVKSAISKSKETSAPVETTEAATTSETDSPSKEQQTTQPPASNNLQLFLKDADELLNKIANALNEASVFIKTEDGALDLVSRTDKEGLKKAIESFINSVHPPMDDVFEASTKLTKTNGNEKEIPEEIYTGIVKLGKGLIHFGKLIYEKMAELVKTLDVPIPEESKNSFDNEPNKLDSEELPGFPPIVHRRVIIFNTNPSSSIVPKNDDGKEITRLTI